MKTTAHLATPRESPRSDHNNIRIGIFLILIGSVFAAETYLRVHILYRFWPLVLTAWGCGFIGIYLRRKRREAAFLGLGLYVIFFSLFSLYFTFSGWESLSRLWPAYIGFLGAMFLFLFLFHRSRRIYLLIGVFLGCVCGAFFLVFYLSGDLWWTTFILVGLSVLAFGRAR